MSRQFLGLALVFAAVFAGMYALSSSMAPPGGHGMPIAVSMLVAIFVTLLMSIIWTVWQTLRAGPWAPRTRAREVREAVAMSPWWSGRSVDCAGGTSDAGGCGDFGG